MSDSIAGDVRAVVAGATAEAASEEARAVAPARLAVRSPRGAVLVVSMMLGTLAHLFWPGPQAVWFTGAAAALFLLLERRRIPPGIRRVALVLGVITVALLPVAAAPLASLSRGIAIGGLMVSIIASVTLLARAALASPHTAVVASHLLSTGVRSRYAWFSIAGQLFGGLLGMAGVSMLLDMASKGQVAREEDRLSMFAAITRSFAAATLWSPMFSNVTILIALYPGLSWGALVPLCLGLAGGAIAVGTALDFWRTRGRPNAVPASRPARPLARALVPMLLAMSAFLGLVIGVAHLLDVAVAGAIVMMIPPTALAMHTLLARGPKRLAEGARQLGGDYLALPALAGEVALFMAAGCGGTVIASAIPQAWTGAVGAVLAQSPVLACLALMLTIIGLAFLAVHPVLSSVMVASCFPPAMLGLPVIPHLAAILVGWAVSSSATPFSMIALMASRYSGLSVYSVTVRVNHVFALVYLGICAAALGVAATLMRGMH